MSEKWLQSSEGQKSPSTEKIKEDKSSLKTKELETWLQQNQLADFREVWINELGVKSVEDIAHLRINDIKNVNLRPVQKNKFKKLITPLISDNNNLGHSDEPSERENLFKRILGEIRGQLTAESRQSLGIEFGLTLSQYDYSVPPPTFLQHLIEKGLAHNNTQQIDRLHKWVVQHLPDSLLRELLDNYNNQSP